MNCKEIFERAHQTLAKHSSRLTSAIQKKTTILEELEHEQQEALAIIESLVDARYYKLENVTNLYNIEDQLATRAEQARKSRDEALRVKQERKQTKVEYTAKIELLKAEMDKLNEKNSVIQKKLPDESLLPLVCRLMKHQNE